MICFCYGLYSNSAQLIQSVFVVSRCVCGHYMLEKRGKETANSLREAYFHIFVANTLMPLVPKLFCNAKSICWF